MSELEHALRAALSDPPVERPPGINAMHDIERRLWRRRQRRRRAGLGALAAGVVAAVVVPIATLHPSLGSSGSGGSAAADAKAGAAAPGGGAVAVPAAVRVAAAKAAHAPGSRTSRQAQWVRTTAARWAQLAHDTGSGQRNIAVYVIQLRGHFTCYDCSHPAGSAALTGVAQIVVVPVHPGQDYAGGFGPAPRPYDLAKLGAVHTFNPH